MSCRTGSLRAVRALTRLHNASLGPSVGREIDFACDRREHHAKRYTRHEVTAARAGRFQSLL
jgi:hypothetical protein